MSNEPSFRPPAWRQSRYGFVAFQFLSLVVLWFALRVVLLIAFKPATPRFSQILFAFASGLQRDILVALVMNLPTFFWLLLLPENLRKSRPHRALFWSMECLFWFVQIFLVFAEFFFFDEFKSRFNTVAVDYLWYPHEVFVNIWESYHVAIVLSVCGALSLGWIWLACRLFASMWERSYSFASRLAWFVATGAGCIMLALSIDLKGAHVGPDRTLNEIANNGGMAFGAAAWTHDLDYSAYYETLNLDEAYQRTRRLLTEPRTAFVSEGHSILRRVEGDPARPRLNVVLFLEESLGSEFWGCLGRKDTLTPEMDKLAMNEGLLFTNLYASGNRTVRGFEGVLSSFPPLPGDAIVKRDLSANVETIARVLKRDGYSTIFLYGGRGLFDGMRSFALNNGYERFIEQRHFDHPTFKTGWGVCDEDLFDRAIEELRQLNSGGKPFLATILSVSNHKPYTYPKGRIPEDPDKQERNYAVKYSDYALGRFFRAAKAEPFWTNTLFVVVADHGARVYGQQSIPIHSYEIPLVILGPAVVKTSQRIGQLGCSLDVSPTLLGLLGRPYQTLFFGRDLLKTNPVPGRALLNHNRDIGMLVGDRMVVLRLMKTVEFYQGNPKQMEMTPLTNPGAEESELQKDAMAIYQVADDLYIHERYRIDGNASAAANP